MRYRGAVALLAILVGGCATEPAPRGEPTSATTETAALPSATAETDEPTATPDLLPETDGIEVRPPSEGVLVGSTHLVFLGTEERDDHLVARFVNHGPLVEDVYAILLPDRKRLEVAVEEGILVSEPFDLPATDPAVVLVWGDELVAWEIDS